MKPQQKAFLTEEVMMNAIVNVVNFVIWCCQDIFVCMFVHSGMLRVLKGGRGICQKLV